MKKFNVEDFKINSYYELFSMDCEDNQYRAHNICICTEIYTEETFENSYSFPKDCTHVVRFKNIIILDGTSSWNLGEVDKEFMIGDKNLYRYNFKELTIDEYPEYFI